MFGMTYSKSRYYEHSQAQFIRYEMTWEMGNRVVPMLKYYTVVNGVSFSVNLFCWDEDLSEADETLVQQVVDSMQWDEILEPTEEFLGYTSASLGGSLTILAGVLAACGLLFAAFTYEDWKPIVQKWFKKGSTGKRK